MSQPDRARADALVESLLRPLDRVEPVLRNTRSRPRGMPLMVGVAVAAAVVIGGAAIAATGWGPLAGIGAAERPATPADEISPAVVAQLRAVAMPRSAPDSPVGEWLFTEARLLGTLPDGDKVYVVPTAKAKLCIVVASSTASCSDPVTHDNPITMTTSDAGPTAPPVVWGVTTDDVTAVSFTAAGTPVSVPVRNNFYAWQGSPNRTLRSVSSATVTFADGSTTRWPDRES